VEDTEKLHQYYHQTSMTYYYDSPTLDTLKETPNYLLDCNAEDFDYDADDTLVSMIYYSLYHNSATSTPD
jgi:hypothetical protein